MAESDVDELWQRWKGSADHEARGRLVLHYSPLVKFVVGRLRSTLPTSVEQDDLISEGVVGLMDAIDKFDPGRGHQFSTYAVPRIRGAIVDGMRAADWVPRSTRARIRAQERAAVDLESHLGRTPTTAELAATLEVPPGEVHRTRDERARAAMVHLDSAVAEHALPDALPAPGDGDVLPAGFSQAVRSLPERDQIVIALYYWERLTLAEIGRVLGVGESRVSQLHSRATSSLRSALAADR